jgi:hypothetical protein
MAPLPLAPHVPIDRFRALPLPGLPSPETSGESPDSGERTKETRAASRSCQNPRELPTGRSPTGQSVSMARLSPRAVIVFQPAEVPCHLFVPTHVRT